MKHFLSKIIITLISGRLSEHEEIVIYFSRTALYEETIY